MRAFNNYYLLYLVAFPLLVQNLAQAQGTRVLSHEVKTRCSIRPAHPSSERITSLNADNVTMCKENCYDDLKCMGYEYNGKSESKKCSLLAYLPKRVPVRPGVAGDSLKFCGKLTRDFFKPWITSSTSSERVVIPEPESIERVDCGHTQFIERVDCPHLEQGLSDWHSRTTWPGGTIPQAGANVTLPSNTKVILNKDLSGALGYITIPSTSELIIGEQVEGIRLKALGFNVEGRLTAGSATCLIHTKIEITLLGNRTMDVVTNPPEKMVKGISVTGKLNLHGMKFHKTWSRLAKSAKAGDDYALLQHHVNWKKGQKIVLVTSAVLDSKVWHENEVVKVDFISEFQYNKEHVGSIVYFQSTLQYDHIANSGYQGEVGLLSRMITVSGEQKDSEPTDPDPLNCTQAKWLWGGRQKVPCQDKDLTGYGGHIIIHNGGKGYVEGVELHRMGQTNVLGRYPIHFHLLGNNCNDCYFRQSSVHQSFYRCVSIHGTHNLTVTENVGYDVTGYCYYLEDGVEEDNTLSFNLGAFIHHIGEAATGDGQNTELAYQSEILTLPADVTASAFYITNVHNRIIGNAASGGWSGFAFPSLRRPIGGHKHVYMKPSSRTSLELDGNTVHSTGWWWYHAAGFYFGGALYTAEDGQSLIYNAGRDQSKGGRSTCLVDLCLTGNCEAWCAQENQAWVRMTNSKAFLIPSVGTNSWSGRMEVVGYEAHDVGLALEALNDGFWIDNMLAVCRTGESLLLPEGSRTSAIKGDGFFWYDTNQEHIITNSLFRNCGYRSDEFNQYDVSPYRGCSNADVLTGCSTKSTVFGFLTHSNQFNPEVMQATKNITFQNCGRRFRLHDYNGGESTVSGRLQNWLDVDGSASDLGEPVIMGSGHSEAGLWWHVENDVVDDPQGPLKFIKINNGRNRTIGHIQMRFDESVHSQVGNQFCQNGGPAPCDALGYIKHWGTYFASDLGLPVTAASDVAGPTGGFGWLFTLLKGAPKYLKLQNIEIDPTSPLVLGIPYPSATTVQITAKAAWCNEGNTYSCQEIYHEVASPKLVRSSAGNVYHMSDDGFLTVRIIYTPPNFIGNPDWIFPQWDTPGKWGHWYAIDRFSRGGVRLIKQQYGPYIEISADCPIQADNTAYCQGTPTTTVPDVCSIGFEQVAYDKCCSTIESTDCVFA